MENKSYAPDAGMRHSGKFVNGAHEITYPVYYEDTDAGGVVYYGNYLRFAERARTEALFLAGVEHRSLLKSHGVWFVVRRCEIDYYAPGKLDDLLTLRTSLKEMRNTSIVMTQEVFSNGTLIAKVEAFVVCVTPDVKPHRIPEKVREALLAKLPLVP